METKRTELHEKLCDILGSRQVYFQPGPNVTIHYPCIVYRKGDIEPIYANDKTYIYRERYTLKVISRDPTNSIAEDLLLNLQLITYTNRYVSDNLYHDTLEIYY